MGSEATSPALRLSKILETIVHSYLVDIRATVPRPERRACPLGSRAICCVKHYQQRSFLHASWSVPGSCIVGGIVSFKLAA